MTVSPQAVIAVLDALNASGGPYIITGSLASNLYQIPRSTLDADFVVDMTSEQREELFRTLRAAYEQEPQMAFETVTGKVQHKFRHRASKFLIEIFEANMDDPFERSRFQRRQQGNVEGRAAFVPTAEDVIIQKLRWFARIRRAKDRDDAIQVLFHQWHHLDWSYLEQWCDEHDTHGLLSKLRSEVQTMLQREE